MNGLLFDQEAKNWNEAIPVGNGFLGGMVFGGAFSERIQVNEDSVWSGGFIDRVNPDARENIDEIRNLLFQGKVAEAEELAGDTMISTIPQMRYYQPLGDVWINFQNDPKARKVKNYNNVFTFVGYDMPEVSNYRRTLALDTALGNISYEVHGHENRREFFASNPAGAIVYHLESDAAEGLNFLLTLSRKENRPGHATAFCDKIYAEHDSIYLSGTNGGADGIGYEMAAKVQITGGSLKRCGSRLRVSGASEATIYITGRTTYRSEDPHSWCVSRLEEAAAVDYEKLKEDHVTDYKSIYDRSRLELEKAETMEATPERLQKMREGEVDYELINTYYNFSRYLAISASREGSLPMNLQGIWNEEMTPMWGSRYTLNINTEMNYWTMEKTGMADLHMPLISHLKQIHKRGTAVAKEMYGAEGFCCHHNTDLWGDSAPEDSGMGATIWPMGGAWLCLHLISHYRYGKDPKFLREYAPILKDCLRFYNSYLVKNQDGFYVTGPSTSPENIFLTTEGDCGSLCMGPSMDMEILHELYQGYLEIAEDLKKLENTDDFENSNDADEQLLQRSREVYEKLLPLRVTEDGRIAEWMDDVTEADMGHRHISQLFALYPGRQISVKESALCEAALKTLEKRLANGGGHTGWSKAWIILFYARLHKGKEAWSHINELLAKATLDNLFDNHPPFQIDGNFGGAAGILETLVQDNGDVVTLLPAIPKDLPDGKLTGIHLECGAVLDFEWYNGQVTSCCLNGKRQGEVCLTFNEKEHQVSFEENSESTCK